jgi:diguanylate cyclase (GGDEF)-like protein
MKDNTSAIQYKEGQQYLFESTYRTLPYGLITASVLALYLYLCNAPHEVILLWLAVLIIIVCIRMLHCKVVISKELFNSSLSLQLAIFVLLTLIAGLVVNSIYFLASPYMSEPPQYIIILSFAVMIAGSITPLGVYYPAFFVYVLSIFMPAIIYNYSIGDANHIILASILLLYVSGLTTVTKAHRNILKEIFFLTKQNEDLSNKFKQLSITDPLTNLYNRRHFTTIIKKEYKRAKRKQQAIILILIDVDNFKLVNDNFGHPFGDDFLIYAADYLRNYLAPVAGVIFRLGGDEFAALVANITEAEIKKLCEEIKANFIKNPKFDGHTHSSNHANILDQISLSIGVVYIPHNAATKMEQIFEKADQLLYQAKSHGKNEIKYTKIT